MKVKLLKKLRKEAKKRYVIVYSDSWYEIREYYSGRKTRHCDFVYELEKVVKTLNNRRRDFILLRISEFRSERINKELKKL